MIKTLILIELDMNEAVDLCHDAAAATLSIKCSHHGYKAGADMQVLEVIRVNIVFMFINVEFSQSLVYFSTIK